MAFHLDRAALARISASDQVRGACHRVAEHVADAVRRQGHVVNDNTTDGHTTQIPLPVEVLDDRDSDGAVVIIDHPAGAAEQAKNGVLTRAAAEAGLRLS